MLASLPVPSVPYRALCSSTILARLTPERMAMSYRLVLGVWNQFGNHADQPVLTIRVGRSGTIQPALWAAGFHTIEKYLRSPTLAIGLDAKLVDLRLHLAHQFLLVHRQFLTAFL